MLRVLTLVIHDWPDGKKKVWDLVLDFQNEKGYWAAILSQKTYFSEVQVITTSPSEFYQSIIKRHFRKGVRVVEMKNDFDPEDYLTSNRKEP